MLRSMTKGGYETVFQLSGVLPYSDRQSLNNLTCLYEKFLAQIETNKRHRAEWANTVAVRPLLAEPLIKTFSVDFK